MPTLEGKSTQLDGDYKKRKDPVRKCYEAAKENGWSLFTVSFGGACNSGPDAMYTYPFKGIVSCHYTPGPKDDAVFVIHGKQLVSFVSHIAVLW